MATNAAHCAVSGTAVSMIQRMASRTLSVSSEGGSFVKSRKNGRLLSSSLKWVRLRSGRADLNFRSVAKARFVLGRGVGSVALDIDLVAILKARWLLIATSHVAGFFGILARLSIDSTEGPGSVLKSAFRLNHAAIGHHSR